jgi:hypothetical protein
MQLLLKALVARRMGAASPHRHPATTPLTAPCRPDLPAAVEAAQQAAAAARGAAPAHLQALKGGEAQLVFLGTMSACPSKYRNVTSLYLDLGHRGGLLMDAGEDCYGQLQRRWVIETINDKL